MGQNTHLDLARTDPCLIRKRWSVVLERTVRELQGTSCIDLEDAPADKRQIACTRSFGGRISDLDSLVEAVSAFATRAAEKLRRQAGEAGQVLAFVRTSPFSDGPRHAESATIRLRRPTSDSMRICGAALEGLRRIYRPGFEYAKAGVMLLDIRSSRVGQAELDLDGTGDDRTALMRALDDINGRFGRGSLRLASEGFDDEAEWRMRQELRTPRYTTRLEDIPIAVAG